MIMSGIITEQDFTLKYPSGIPEYFNPAHLPTIECEKLVWFDEVDTEQHGGLYQVLVTRSDFAAILTER